MTKSEHAEAKARCDAATPGPWGYDLNHTVAAVDVDEWGETIVQIPRGVLSPLPRDESNLEHIAHSRTDLPAALEEIRRLVVVLAGVSCGDDASVQEAIAVLDDWEGGTAAMKTNSEVGDLREWDGDDSMCSSNT